MLSWARLGEAGGCADWEQRLRARAEPHEAERLRRATFSGTPFGAPDFSEGFDPVNLPRRSRA
jgi:hypothetical protein